MRSASYGETFNPTIVDKLGVWLSSRSIRRFVPSFAGKRVGDFGCGFQATFARTIASEAAAITLVDVSLDAALRALPNVTTVEAPLLAALPRLADGSLDVIMCISVLEHMWEPEEALKHFHRILAPGGVCLLNVPSWRGKRYLELSAFKLKLSPQSEMDDHKMYYDVEDFWPLLVRAGFAPSRIKCFTHKLGLNTFAVCTKEKG